MPKISIFEWLINNQAYSILFEFYENFMSALGSHFSEIDNKYTTKLFNNLKTVKTEKGNFYALNSAMSLTHNGPLYTNRYWNKRDDFLHKKNKHLQNATRNITGMYCNNMILRFYLKNNNEISNTREMSVFLVLWYQPESLRYLI